ncbi:MAG: S9 family peptidase [Phycisphaerales bacterium]|nr:S9 family peptidase [Phycisphaerales bacterium]
MTTTWMSGMKRSMVLAAALIATGASVAMAAPLDYPNTKKDSVVDTYHGVNVPDPYRWLEDSVHDSQAVADWVKAENKVTFGYLEKLKQREPIRKRLTDVFNYERFGMPRKVAGTYYFSKNDGLQNQSVLYRMASLDSAPEVLIDPNTWSTDGTKALAGTFYSDDGRFMAYAVADGGSDWRTIKVRDLRTNTDLADEVNWVKFSGASWMPDGSGFFYARYDEPKEGATFTQKNVFHKLYFHRIGTPQADDVLVFQNEKEPEWNFGGGVTEDGHYLIISVSRSTQDENIVYYKDLSQPLMMPVRITPEFEYAFDFVGNDGPVFFFKTNKDAPLNRVVSLDTRKLPNAEWKEVIPEGEFVLEGVGITANMFVCNSLEHASDRFRMYRLDGSFVRDVQLPGVGAAGGFGGRMADTETFYSYTSFNDPGSIYRYDMITGESTLFRKPTVDFDGTQYEVKQVFYSSKDGTRVPMFICHKKGLKLDGNNPTLLYGYGGFNISLTPYFTPVRAVWMEMGGVFAQPNLRGGGEYGQAWHDAGRLTNKQNVFDDFIAAAEFLIDQGYTNPKKLAIQGGSNGGLLVGACMTQRPDLFGACLPAVGVMDMLRYHKFTIGRAWADDYGLSDDEEHPEQFEALYAYSPYHNIRDGVAYPPTMVTTADYDDRVVPAHSFKFAARMQAAQAGDNPILIRIEERAGHGAGTPVTKTIEQYADIWGFLAENLHMDLPPRYRQ